MRVFTGKCLGRIVVINLERGEKLLESVREKLKELNIKNAVLISGIGTFRTATIHRVTSFNSKPEEEFITIEQPMELSSVDGIVAEGEPHFHMTFSDLESTYSGHLENECEILYLAEIVLAEIVDLELVREFQENVKLLKQK